MKRVPPFSEFENDMQSLKSLLQEMCKIIYKYDFETQDTEEEFINIALEDFNFDLIRDIKEDYELYFNKQINQN